MLAVGDAEFQDKAIGKMQDVSREEGRTVLFVSHNMAAVRNLCNKGLVLHNGKIAFQGTAIESISNYLNSNTIASEDLIIDHVKYNSEKILVNDIKVNGIKTNKLKLNENDEIEIYISGEINQNLKVSFEMRIFDQNELPIIFFSPDHETGIVESYPKGDFQIVKKIKLPFGLTKGMYYAHISLTNPLVEGYLDISKALIIDYQGHSTKKGFVFEYI